MTYKGRLAFFLSLIAAVCIGASAAVGAGMLYRILERVA